ncbi:hypothetical protein [[Ruminococcus] torques]|uniref:hypothetical protein n=1 Tax=[Ruminococcus] torques TaxID=33039 RepID=UPI003F94855A
MALGIEKAGFEPLGLIEFDKDAAESLKTNRPNWRVIHDDIANISCLDLEDYFGIKKRRTGFIIGRGTVSGFFLCWKKIRTWKMQEEHFFITMQLFYRNYSQRCFYLKMCEDCLTHDKGRTYANDNKYF